MEAEMQSLHDIVVIWTRHWQTAGPSLLCYLCSFVPAQRAGPRVY